MPKLTCLILLCLGLMTTHAQTRVAAEFRGVWVATINNIDWPAPGVTNPEQQKKAFLELLDFYADLNFNAIIFQVRPAGDAFYPSELAPWSRFLTGEEGRGRWKEDPLAFMIREAHKRDLEFHAWLNPYRATANLDTEVLHSSHVFYQHRDWIRRYGNRYYLDPGMPAVRAHVEAVVAEIVANYAVDGIHFDDYFYPYPMEGLSFDDRRTFIQHGLNDFDDRDDWRRANVDSLVAGVSETIRSINPDVSFGISPFGVWRNIDKDPKGSRTNASVTTYDDLYADPLVWCRQGWVDYVAPQLYWSSYFERAPYPLLVRWWNQNTFGIPVYVGHGIYKVGDDRDRVWNDLNEVPRQIAWNRSMEAVKGSIFYSAKSLRNLPRLQQKLKQDVFDEKVLTRINYRERRNIGPPDIQKVRARRNTLFVDLDLKGIGSTITSILVLNNSVFAREKIVTQQRLGETPNLQVPLEGDEMELVLAYLSKHNEIGLQSKVIKAEREDEGWKIEVR